jgi:hypothetical protein
LNFKRKKNVHLAEFFVSKTGFENFQYHNIGFEKRTCFEGSNLKNSQTHKMITLKWLYSMVIPWSHAALGSLVVFHTRVKLIQALIGHNFFFYFDFLVKVQ